MTDREEKVVTQRRVSLGEEPQLSASHNVTKVCKANESFVLTSLQ